MTNKISIVAGDGGIRGGFIAGALGELYSSYDLGEAELIAASSASVAGLLYHFSHGKDHPAEFFWTKALLDPEFMGQLKLKRFIRGQSVFNLDFLIDTAIKEREPYSLEGVFGTSQPYFFPVISYETRKTVFITNSTDAAERAPETFRAEIRAMDSSNIYEYVKAAKSAPVLYDKTVNVDGHEYLDGGLREPFTLDLPGMEDSKIILVVSSRYWTFSRNINYMCIGALWYLRSLFGEKARLKRWVYRELMKKFKVHRQLHRKVKKLQKEGRLFLIAPESNTGYDKGAENVIAKGFYDGVDATKNNIDELMKFIRTS